MKSDQIKSLKINHNRNNNTMNLKSLALIPMAKRRKPIDLRIAVLKENVRRKQRQEQQQQKYLSSTKLKFVAESEQSNKNLISNPC